MKYVLDSSVGFKTLVAEKDSAKAQQLCDDYRKGIHQLLAPDVPGRNRSFDPSIVRPRFNSARQV